MLNPALPPGPSARARQRRALGFLALGALAVLVRLAMPVGIGLFLGALVAFTLEPFYARLRAQHLKPGVSALVCALGATLGIAGGVLATGLLLVTSGLGLFDTVKESVAPGGALRAILERDTARLATFHIRVEDLPTKLESEVVALGTRAAGIAADVAGLTFNVLLTLLFMTMGAYFILRHWDRLVEEAELLLPFDRRHTRALLGQLKIVGRQVLLGTVFTGLLQGVLAAIGYWATGVQAPAFFGALTALSSLIPAVGSVLVWALVGVALLLTGHVGAGVAELVYSALIVGILTDYVIRPRIVGSEKGVPAILVFVALFGGIEVFGVVGLIVGPVLATMSLAVLRTYAREAEATPPGASL